MPVKCDWNDCKSSAALIAAPLGIVAIGWWYFSGKHGQDNLDWFNKLRTPNWLAKNPSFVAPMDLLTAAPIGYAAHLIMKEPLVKSADRQVAMGLFTATAILMVGNFAAFYNNRDLKCWIGTTALVAGVSGATAVAFYKINPNAGLMMAPLALWTAYYSAGLFATIQGNPIL